MAKSKKPVKPTPGSAAYRVVLEAIGDRYEEYAEGNAEDDDFTTPGKQKKVAKQLAKHHSRILKKSKLSGIDPLDEDL